MKQEEKDWKVCQNCKAHSNKPSYCHRLKKFVGRKFSCKDGNFKNPNPKWEPREK